MHSPSPKDRGKVVKLSSLVVERLLSEEINHRRHGADSNLMPSSIASESSNVGEPLGTSKLKCNFPSG